MFIGSKVTFNKLYVKLHISQVTNSREMLTCHWYLWPQFFKLITNSINQISTVRIEVICSGKYSVNYIKCYFSILKKYLKLHQHCSIASEKRCSVTNNVKSMFFNGCYFSHSISTIWASNAQSPLSDNQFDAKKLVDNLGKFYHFCEEIIWISIAASVDANDCTREC